jgi:hypothetical protein
MAKLPEVRIIELEDDICKGTPSTLSVAFVRITVENHLNNQELIDEIGDTVLTYDEQYIKAFFNKYDNDVIEYAYILHENDVNEKGEVEQAHYHICMRKTNKTNFKFDMLKHAFPVGKIEQGRTWEYMLQYLLHKNHPERTPHTEQEIVTNIDRGTLDLYLKSTPSVKKRSALERNFDKLQDDILEYKIFQYQFREQLATNKMFRKLMAEFDTKIEKSFVAQKVGWYEKYKHTRSLEVIFIEGGGGCGKTALAIAYCQQRKWSYYIASDENDPMQDYASQDCLILDELRDDTFSYSSFMRILNTYTGTTVKSRYHNKAFTGEAIIIPSYLPLSEYYKPDVKKKKKYVADESFYGDNSLVQLHRRIKTLVRAEKDLFYVYDHKKDGSNILREKIPNPAYLIKPEEDKSRVSTEDFVGASEIFAQTLIESGKVDAEEYKLFKAYMNERLSTPNDVIFNANGAPITFEDYKAYHNAKELAGGELLDSEGKRIELKDFVREDRIIPALPEQDITLDFTEDDMRVTQYFERCMLKELQDKVAILQKAIEILRTDKTA